MDERSVQTVIFTISGRKPWYWLSPAEAAREAALVNDAGFEANKLYPKRIFLEVSPGRTGAELELWSLRKEQDYFREVFGRELFVTLA